MVEAGKRWIAFTVLFLLLSWVGLGSGQVGYVSYRYESAVIGPGKLIASLR